jgi:hypothetical protein
MNYQVIAKTLVAGAVSALVAACGGGGGGSVSVAPPPEASLNVSGTAAIGAALANAAVEVKCATGTGTATTGADGSYSVSMKGAALPCFIKVTGTGSAASITLHSVTEAGSTNAADATTSATANVTPLTELVVAQLTAGQPSAAFASFDSKVVAAITTTSLASATTKVVTALKGAGIDLGTIDPFKAQLVAASSTAPTGNAYDKLLDQLAAKVPADALPQLVMQVAAAAATNSSTGLTDAMVAVDGGSLPGCSSALSGKYRTLDYWGKTVVREINFKNKTFQAADGKETLAITQDATNACTITATGVVEGVNIEWQVAFGPSGAGTYRARSVNPNTPGVVGYIFPVQAHTYAELAGTWSFLQSGVLPGEGALHFPGQITFNADRKAPLCDYKPSANWACQAASDSNLSVSDRSDGGFDLNEPAKPAAGNLYGYRAPNGTLTLFGTTNASGSSAANAEQTILVATKLSALPLPVKDTVNKFSEVLLTRSFNGVVSTSGQTADANTVIATDTAAGTLTRKRASDGREDTFKNDTPLAGMRYRDFGTNVTPVYQIPLTGLGITVSVNIAGASTHLYSLATSRP